MKKNVYPWILFAASLTAAAGLTGCGKGKTDSGSKAQAVRSSSGDETSQSSSVSQTAQTTIPETVTLTVWGAKEDEELLRQIIGGFQEAYQGHADFIITYQPQGESGCKDALMADLEAGADVFAFADDQLNTLVAAGALEPVEDWETVKAANLKEAVEAASVGGTLYAYPLTADNGYFLYYNKQYFDEEDITSLDRMLAIAADSGKTIAMDWSSAWYVYALFGNTGLEVGLNEDGITNYCTWNGTDGDIKGTDVAAAMLRIAQSPGFASLNDEGFLKGVQDGSVIAGVSGVWNAMAVEEAWGNGYGAARLPSYTCAGKQVQMASFSGYKLIGVNAYSKHYDWALRMAEWITSEANQELRFQMRGQGPSNKNAAASKEVQQSPAIVALLEQSEFSRLQRVGGNFWLPVETFSQNMAAGNPENQSLQEQLDKMVEGVTAQ